MRSTLVMVAAVLMSLSSAAHGLVGWPAMLGELRKVDAPGDLVGALSAGWYWGSCAMVAFGLIVLISALRLRRGDSSGVAAIRVIAAVYVVFGLAAFLSHRLNPHFLLFVATGLLAGIPVLSGQTYVSRK